MHPAPCIAGVCNIIRSPDMLALSHAKDLSARMVAVSFDRCKGLPASALACSGRGLVTRSRYPVAWYQHNSQSSRKRANQALLLLLLLCRLSAFRLQ